MSTLRRRPAVYAIIAAGTFAVLLAALWLGGGWPQPDIPGLPSPGPLTSFGLPIVRVVHDACAVATVGLLLAAVALAGGSDDRRRLTRIAGQWALAWAATAVVTQVLTLSDLLGLPIGEALESGFLINFSTEVPQGEAFLIVTLITLVIAAATTLTLGPLGRALLLALAVFAVLPPAYVGHSASAADHNLAVSSLMLHIAGVTMWVGGLFALVLALRGSDDLPAAVRRFSALALCCFVAVGFSGAVNAWIRIGDLSELWQSRYGLLVVGKIVALVALGWFGLRHRRRTIAALEAGTASRPFLRLATAEVGVMACTLGLAVALSRTPPPGAGSAHSSHELLGYTLRPFTAGRLITDIRPDPIVILAVAGLAVAYLLGARRWAGGSWPAGRVVAALVGLAVLLYATAGGLAAYAPAIFSAHALQYALVGTLAPALIALSAPLVPLREVWTPLRAAVEGPQARALTHPWAAFGLYAAPYLIFYAAGLFEPAQSSLAVRLAVWVVLFTTGTWFFCVALGLDPLPRAIGPLQRMLMLAGALAVQAWMAVVFLAGPVQGQDWYEDLALPWAPDRAADQLRGAALGPGVAAVTIAALLVVLAVRRRVAARRVASDAPVAARP
ncbi:copper resistance D precursor [Sphaerisporangium krabiense]|uniref:Putative copper resistance protein D n=1 Tax=Sphaerisporangium krabiense TaxID=763782 RepID=A0A7W8Z2K9_9ACTN|nr:cytochrome c oxidase assembly protein [Sphaerisporangium krabiense]MBB5626298.1 putative copper resistance protein D [Sphaerisporangium krabiense]GII66037.1 copper resistance D precursor [Sphaerisporangium krabiense]